MRPQVQLKGDDTAVPSEGCAAHGSTVLLAEMGIAQRQPRLRTSFSAPRPSKTLSRATGEVGGNLWDEAMFSLPHANWQELRIAVPAVKGQNKRRLYSGAVSSQARAPGQPLQGHLLHSCLRCCLAWSGRPSLLTACFPPGLAIFSSFVLSQAESALAGAVVQPGAYRQLTENTGTTSDLSAFIRHAQMITVPSLSAGQLLSRVSLYHLQRVYGSQVASSLSPQSRLIVLLAGASNMVLSLGPHSYLQAISSSFCTGSTVGCSASLLPGPLQTVFFQLN